MQTLQELLAALPTYAVQPLDSAIVMQDFHSAATKLLGEITPENLTDFNYAQRTACYLIDELAINEPDDGKKVQEEVLRISGEIFIRLDGLKVLEQKPPETEKAEFYKWAISARYTQRGGKIAA